jgi:hypothetical protein
MRRRSEHKKEGVTGKWRKCPSENLHILYSSPNIVTVIKLRSMRWALRVARIGMARIACTILV